jgi:hypothetical protein
MFSSAKDAESDEIEQQKLTSKSKAKPKAKPKKSTVKTPKRKSANTGARSRGKRKMVYILFSFLSLMDEL